MVLVAQLALPEVVEALRLGAQDLALVLLLGRLDLRIGRRRSRRPPAITSAAAAIVVAAAAVAAIAAIAAVAAAEQPAEQAHAQAPLGGTPRTKSSTSAQADSDARTNSSAFRSKKECGAAS